MTKPTDITMWIKLEIAGVGEIGPGKIGLLKRIREHGSISAAARSMQMSYRRAWQLADELNHLLGEPLVETHIGGRSRGGAQLTPLGAAVIEHYAAIVQRSNDSCHDLLVKFPRSTSTHR
jgi:molybdate transport system regulatory protein